MTPPISPRRIRPSRSALGVVPSIRTTSFWPTSWARVGPCRRRGAVDGLAGAAEGRADRATTAADDERTRRDQDDVRERPDASRAHGCISMVPAEPGARCTAARSRRSARAALATIRPPSRRTNATLTGATGVGAAVVAGLDERRDPSARRELDDRRECGGSSRRSGPPATIDELRPLHRLQLAGVTPAVGHLDVGDPAAGGALPHA